MFERIKSIVWRDQASDKEDGSWVSSFFGHSSARSQYMLLKEYKNIVYSCINAIAEDVGKYEPVFSKTDPKVEVTRTPHDFEKILEQPSPTLSKYDLFFSSQVYLELMGEAYWYVELGEKSRKPKSITFMRPDRVRHAYNEATGDITGYVYMNDAGREMPLDLDEVIFIKKFNPESPRRGLGTVQAALLYIDTDTATSTFQNNFMRNQATPSGVLQVTGQITPEAFKKLKTIWSEQQAGLNNAGKTLFIRSSEAKFTKMGLSIADLEMGTLKKITKEDVREMFKVPAQILGSTESSGAGGLGRANLEAVEYIFAKRTIEPKLKQWDDVVQMAVRRYYKENIFVTHVSQIPEDMAAILEEDKAGAHKWIRVNEIRKRRNLPAVPGGDDLYYDSRMLPLGTKQEAAKSVAKAFDLGGPKRLIKVVTKADKDERYFNELRRIEAAAAKEYDAVMSKYLIKQERRVKERINSIYGGKKKDISDDLADVIAFGREDLTADLYSLLILMLADAAEKGIDFVGKPDVEFILEQAVRNSIFDATDRLTKSFNDDTVQLLQKTLGAGLANKESIEELTKRVEAVYAEAEGYRAKRIANTEAHKSKNYGVSEGYRQSGVKKMKWRAINPSCKFCAAMNGTVTTIGQPFLSKGDKVVDDEGKEYIADYTDVLYADLHPNCDCELEPI